MHSHIITILYSEGVCTWQRLQMVSFLVTWSVNSRAPAFVFLTFIIYQAAIMVSCLSLFSFPFSFLLSIFFLISSFNFILSIFFNTLISFFSVYHHLAFFTFSPYIFLFVSHISPFISFFFFLHIFLKYWFLFYLFLFFHDRYFPLLILYALSVPQSIQSVWISLESKPHPY